MHNFSSCSFFSRILSTSPRYGRVVEALQRGLNFSTAWWTMQLISGEKDLKHLCRRWSLWTFAVTLLASHFVCHTSQPSPSPLLDNIRVMVTVIVWRLKGNIIRTALCWIVWHNVRSLQHSYVNSSYRSNGLALSHWDPHAVRRGGCLQLYYCNMVEWFWWDSSLI